MQAVKNFLSKVFDKAPGGGYRFDYNPDTQTYTQLEGPGMKKGGKVSSASKRADGCAQRGKTKGRMV